MAGVRPENASAAPWLPQPAKWNERSVQAQTDDETSMLELYRTALHVRREHPALGDGTMTWLDTPPDVISFHRNSGLTCVVNLSTEPFQLPDHTVWLKK
jgi:alpha-glucosidase